jgi:prevent-host-death family protein
MANPIEIPASEVRERISDVINRVAYGRERVVISRNGKPQVALISIADFEWLKQQEAKAEPLRQRAIEAVAAIQERAQRAGLDKLTDEEIDALIADTRRARRAKGRE